jgi:hypothetical protein
LRQPQARRKACSQKIKNTNRCSPPYYDAPGLVPVESIAAETQVSLLLLVLLGGVILLNDTQRPILQKPTTTTVMILMMRD